MSKKVTRLFEQFQPEHYQLHLIPDRDNMTFKGTVAIHGKKTGRPTKRITLHQKDLKITGAQILKKDKKGDINIEVSRINLQKSFDEVRLHTEQNITAGDYHITIDFEGKITRPMNGIYPCSFKHDGKNKILIATQFESHHAREAFPCIDEPEAKATFELALTVPKEDTALSNTPQRSILDEGDLSIHMFEKTPKMSTYLLAFVYGDIKYLEKTTKDGVKVRTYATPDNVEYTDFALDVAVKSLEFYNKYFDIPYPLDKCDFVALPDFASGAMENWGLITFREQIMLVDPKNTSLHLKQYVANVVAHELTHQWFGNLVTMRWWTDLWLNESFASWMSWLAVDHIFPDWKVWNQFIVDEQSIALKLDALEHTHPIEVEVKHPDEIRTIFDAISYEKGASVLLMLKNHIGADNFRDGVRLYLKKHSYSNTDTVDLWAAFEEVSGLPIKDFMGQWTSKSGYPIVKVSRDKQSLRLEQERFYLNPKAKKEESVWPIPLQPSSDIKPVLIAKQLQNYDEPKAGLYLNKGRTSFFRAIYDSTSLKQLASNIEKLDELDRLGILSDSSEAAKAGYSSTVDTLRLMEAYKNESSAVVWDIVAGVIGSIRVVMDDEGLRKDLKPYVRNLVADQHKRLGWEEKSSDSHFDKLLRPSILGLASYAEEPEVVKEAISRFEKMTKPEDIHPDLRGVVYGTVARRGKSEDFDKLLGMHDSSKNSEEKVTLSGALTGFEDPKLIKRALAHIKTKEVRLQDAGYWIAYSFSNRHAKQHTWEWMKDNWQWLQDNMGSDLSFFRMPLYAGRNYSDEKFLPEFKAFFNDKMGPAFERPINQAIETIEWQAAWKKRDLAAIKKFLSTQ